MSAALLKSWHTCRFASVFLSQGCCPNIHWVLPPDLCCDLSPDLCCTFSPNLCCALSLDLCRELYPKFFCALSPDLCRALLPNLCHALSPNLCCALSSDLCRAISPNLCRDISPDLYHALSHNLCRALCYALLPYHLLNLRCHPLSNRLSTPFPIFVVILCPIIFALFFWSSYYSFVLSSLSFSYYCFHPPLSDCIFPPSSYLHLPCSPAVGLINQ